MLLLLLVHSEPKQDRADHRHKVINIQTAGTRDTELACGYEQVDNQLRDKTEPLLLFHGTPVVNITTI